MRKHLYRMFGRVKHFAVKDNSGMGVIEIILIIVEIFIFNISVYNVSIV